MKESMLVKCYIQNKSNFRMLAQNFSRLWRHLAPKQVVEDSLYFGLWQSNGGARFWTKSLDYSTPQESVKSIKYHKAIKKYGESMNHRRSDDLGESERLQIRKWMDCCLYFAALSPALPPPASVAPYQITQNTSGWSRATKMSTMVDLFKSCGSLWLVSSVYIVARLSQFGCVQCVRFDYGRLIWSEFCLVMVLFSC